MATIRHSDFGFDGPVNIESIGDWDISFGTGDIPIWVGTVRIYPDHLAYFNDLVGGPRNGHLYLDDSNIDWCQDWIAVAEFQQDRCS